MVRKVHFVDLQSKLPVEFTHLSSSQLLGIIRMQVRWYTNTLHKLDEGIRCITFLFHGVELGEVLLKNFKGMHFISLSG